MQCNCLKIIWTLTYVFNLFKDLGNNVFGQVFWNFENVRQVYEQFNALKMKELWVTLVSIIKHFVNNVHSCFFKIVFNVLNENYTKA